MLTPPQSPHPDLMYGFVKFTLMPRPIFNLAHVRNKSNCVQKGTIITIIIVIPLNEFLNNKCCIASTFPMKSF